MALRVFRTRVGDPGTGLANDVAGGPVSPAEKER
jgi:hypothetical protein